MEVCVRTINRYFPNVQTRSIVLSAFLIAALGVGKVYAQGFGKPEPETGQFIQAQALIENARELCQEMHRLFGQSTFAQTAQLQPQQSYLVQMREGFENELAQAQSVAVSVQDRDWIQTQIKALSADRFCRLQQIGSQTKR